MSIELTVFKFIDKTLNEKQNAPPLDDETVSSIVREKDIVYDAEHADACKLDLHYIPTDEKKPVMLYVHGGGFVAGDKYYRRGISDWFAAHGLFVVNANYGLCPQYSYPMPLVHLVGALNWIADNAEKYGLNVDKIMVSGDSAGAYYAAMLVAACVSPAVAEELGVTPKVKIGAAVYDCGLYDIEAIIKKKMLFGINKKIFRSFTGMKKPDLDAYEHKGLCHPIDCVNADYPPTFVIYAKKDIFVKGQSEQLVEAIKNSGVYCEEYHSEKMSSNHCFPLAWKKKTAKEVNALVAEFIEKFVRGALNPHENDQ